MAEEYCYHYIDILKHNNDDDRDYYCPCYTEKTELYNGSTKNPISIYYDDINPPYGRITASYTAKDYDYINGGYDDDNDTYLMYIYYQGKWILMTPPTIVYNNEDARTEEGYFAYRIYEWNEEKQKTIPYHYCPTYNPLTINGQEVSIDLAQTVVTEDTDIMYSYYDTYSYYHYSYMAWGPPGLWINAYELESMSSAYYEEDEDEYFNLYLRTLGGELNYHYLGDANASGSGQQITLQDGDTSPKVIINDQLVIAQNYDRVYSGNCDFIYYEGTWYNCTDRTYNSSSPSYQLIADMVPPSYGLGDEVPEISEIVNRKSSVETSDVYPDRLIGLDINELTINGTTTQVQLFDTIRLNAYYYASYNRYHTIYYTYCPGGVWMPRQVLLSTEQSSIPKGYNFNSYIPIRGEVLEYDKCVELKWEDPNDITTYEPTPATWEGTIVIRKEDSAPMHRWDGVEIVDSTTRDQYKTDPYRDENIQLGKTYYYGFFPYYTASTEDGHPIKFYRFTAVRRVDTGVDTNAPTILSAVADGTSVTISYKIPAPIEGEYNSIKLYGKIGSNPKGDGNDDVSVDIDRSEDEVIVENLQPESTYYFAIVTIQGEEET